jgi:hypothetical protein
MTLFPCGACGRHVKSSETACPFCGEAFAADKPAIRVDPVGRLQALAVSAAIAMSACGGPVAEPAYGGVPVDAATKDAPDDATGDAPVGQPAYGAVTPPTDGGTSETG